MSSAVALLSLSLIRSVWAGARTRGGDGAGCGCGQKSMSPAPLLCGQNCLVARVTESQPGQTSHHRSVSRAELALATARHAPAHHSRSILEFDHIRRESRRAGGKEGEIKKREREIARLFLYPMGEEGAPLVSQAPSDSRLGPEMRIIMISGRVAVPTRCRAGVLDSYGGSRPWHPSPTPSPLRWKLSSTTRHVEGASQGHCSKRITGSSSVGRRFLLAVAIVVVSPGPLRRRPPWGGRHVMTAGSATPLTTGRSGPE